MSQIPVEKNVFGRDFSKVVDTEFRQLVKNSTQDTTLDISMEQFFQLYEQLFYQIPKEGDASSHRYILNKTADYLGVKIADEVNVDDLLNEITNLRQELLDSQKLVVELTK